MYGSINHIHLSFRNVNMMKKIVYFVIEDTFVYRRQRKGKEGGSAE